MRLCTGKAVIALLGIQLDDKHLVYRDIDLLPAGKCADCALKGFLIDIDPLGSQSSCSHFHDIFEALDGLGALFNLNYIACFYAIRRKVDALAVYKDVLVADNLSCRP